MQTYEEEKQEALEFEQEWAGKPYASLVCEQFIRDGVKSDPKECVCGGSGWIVTPYDTVTQCSQHYKGQPHPDDPIDVFWETSEGLSMLAKMPPR